MRKSDWRKEIQLPEFVDPFTTGTAVVGTAVAIDKALKVATPFVKKKVVPFVTKKAADLLTPKASKEIDKPKVEVKPEVNTNIKGFTPTKFEPKGFTPSKEIENERLRLIKKRELEKINNKKNQTIVKPSEKEIDRLKPKETGTEVKPKETETEVKPKETETDPQREKEKNDNKKKITTITTTRNNQNNNEKKY